MDNTLIGPSRAGDIFHYRWAARRCLLLIYPKTTLEYIVIEGSNENELAGEFVIDLAEYESIPNSGSQNISYYQLKHSSYRKNIPFNLSDLKDTISGFAKRYSDIFISNKKSYLSNLPRISFSIITNRIISKNFKHNIHSIAQGKLIDSRFNNTIKKYTDLDGQNLIAFCNLLNFIDTEGDYKEQKYKLHIEISKVTAGIVDSKIISDIIAFIQEKVLQSNRKIVREDIIKLIGNVSNINDLYPAPPELEELDKPIKQKQYDILLDKIMKNNLPTLIHASGGVGKTIFAQYIKKSVPEGSLGIVYDCFGKGKYRNRSRPRHRHRDGLIQIINELALQHNLCDPLILQPYNSEDEILRTFLSKINKAIESLRKINSDAKLLILIDAADNAEMAAKEYNQNCFVHELLNEEQPEGCSIVVLCRSERIDYLKPSDRIKQYKLGPFSIEETFIHLRRYFPKATKKDALEFHRLTNNGNPRVQKTVLNLGFESLYKVFNTLGPIGTTIEKQIESQIDVAISKIKENYTYNYGSKIDAICTGLAALPPFIPVEVLATAADVHEDEVKSFISDLGFQLWLSDNSIQFRDEPTETWFNQKYSATVKQIESYVNLLKPLSAKFTYVAESLPYLLLRAGKYDELIDLALSDEFLPEKNPIDERNVRIYRLQFAFQAAIKSKHFFDATKLAMRAGEELAGNKRQLDLLLDNIDLIAPLQSREKVQEAILS